MYECNLEKNSAKHRYFVPFVRKKMVKHISVAIDDVVVAIELENRACCLSSTFICVLCICAVYIRCIDDCFLIYSQAFSNGGSSASGNSFCKILGIGPVSSAFFQMRA